MINVPTSWQPHLKEYINSESYINLINWLNQEYDKKNIYPKKENIFAALDYVRLEDVKVVIMGQDPYHGAGQAHGLAFSVEKDVKLPPSLKNIYKELNSDIGCSIPTHGNLTHWAKQGVLLLNTVLTVEQSKPFSHKNIGWEEVTGGILHVLNKRKQPIIFMLWGGKAKALARGIDKEKHIILEAAHPSPLGANQGGWFGCKHFSKANEILKNANLKEIDWQII